MTLDLRLVLAAMFYISLIWYNYYKVDNNKKLRRVIDYMGVTIIKKKETPKPKVQVIAKNNGKTRAVTTLRVPRGK